MLKKMMLVCAIAGLAAASAKTYTIEISHPATVGQTQLRPGEYRVQVEGSKVVFKDNENRTVAETSAKLVTVDKKFQQTSVETNTASGKTMIEDIRLGGTTTKLVLN
jgi:hypothetical protein